MDKPARIEPTADDMPAFLKGTIKLDPGWLAAIVGCSYIVGFILVNAHVGRFRPLEYELLEARYLAAALLFATTTVPPAATIVMVLVMLGYPPRGAARTWPQWKLWAGRGVAGAAGVIVSFLLWDFLLNFAAIKDDLAWTEEGVVYFLLLVLICVLWKSAPLIRKHDPPPEHLRRPDLDSFAMNTIMMALAISLIPLFAIQIFPNLDPKFGGGGAWVARIVPEAETFPAEVAARASPDVVILEASDSYVTLLLCPPAGGEKMEPAVVARSSFAVISVQEMIAVRELEGRCAARPRPLAPARATRAPAAPRPADSTSRGSQVP